MCDSLEEGGARRVWVRLWGTRREAGALRVALARMRMNHVRMRADTVHFHMQPALSLQVSRSSLKASDTCVILTYLDINPCQLTVSKPFC